MVGEERQGVVALGVPRPDIVHPDVVRPGTVRRGTVRPGTPTGYAAERHGAEDVSSGALVDRRISRLLQHDAMPWSSFEPSSVDAVAASGFRLIGRLVRESRGRLGVSQQALGRLAGVDQSVISRLENGKLASLRWSRFAAIVGALGGLGAEEERGGRHQ